MEKTEQLAVALSRSTAKVQEWKSELWKASERVILAEKELQEAKTAALLSGKIDGKNEEARKAQLQAALKEESAKLELAQSKERHARHEAEMAQLDLDLAKYQLRILEIPA